MALPIIYEDDVDWQPLIFRFVPKRALPESEANRLAQFVRDWMDTAARERPDLWSSAKEWDCKATESREVEGHCEFLPESELERLAIEVHDAFPRLKEIRLGVPLFNPTTIKKIDWYTVPDGRVEIEGKTYDVSSFEISFTPITVGQFVTFVNETRYTPVPDILEKRRGFLISHFQLNFGPSPKIPLLGVTNDDASAFCEWAKFRLPTDPELKHFQHTASIEGKGFPYGSICWTSTPAENGKFVAWHGPYDVTRLHEPDSNFRGVLPQHQYQFLDAPCFRVVRASKGRKV